MNLKYWKSEPPPTTNLLANNSFQKTKPNQVEFDKQGQEHTPTIIIITLNKKRKREREISNN